MNRNIAKIKPKFSFCIKIFFIHMIFLHKNLIYG